MATHSSSTSLSCFILLLLLLLCSEKKDYAIEAKDSTNEGSFPQTHTLKVSSLLASDVCNPSSQGFKKSSSLKLVHNYGPCNRGNQGKGPNVPSHKEMLLQDKLRAEAIQAKARLSKKYYSGSGAFKEMKGSVPAQSGTAIGLGTGNYAVTLGLGTPKKDLTFLLDTFNDLTWTQCEPCHTSCNQKDPRFNPAKSTSYKNVSCSSASCNLINGLGQKNCSASTCHYEYQLSDKYLSGFLATETLTISKSDIIKNFLFGCGQKNQGPFGRASGYLGLGRSALSLPSQTASKRFSYCLPSSSSTIGHLTLGGNIPKAVKFTPTRNDSSLYSLEMTGVSVGGRLVRVDESFFEEAGSVTDPGTFISYLPPAVHFEMSKAFRELMTDYPRTDGYANFDTCYDFSGHDTVKIPTISFYFKDGVEVAVHKSGIMIPLPNLKKICLAFASNLEDGNTAIFGSYQQRTYEVVYDIAKLRIGFAPGGCS